MRNNSQRLIVSAIFVLSVCSALTAQVSKPPVSTPRTAHGVDLSGVWAQKRPPATADQYWVYEFSKEEPPMTAWAETQYKAAKPSFGPHSFSIDQTNDPVYRGCFPPGVPRIFLHPFPMQIVDAPGEIIMLFEYDSMRRQIFTDGRPHSDSAGPTWMGDSIGHWENDTLVVDTGSIASGIRTPANSTWLSGFAGRITIR